MRRYEGLSGVARVRREESAASSGDVRRSGRTTAQLRALSPGSVYIVHTVAMREYAGRLLASQRDMPAGVVVVACRTRSDVERLLARRAWHAVADHACPPEVRAAVAEYSATATHRALPDEEDVWRSV